MKVFPCGHRHDGAVGGFPQERDAEKQRLDEEMETETTTCCPPGLMMGRLGFSLCLLSHSRQGLSGSSGTLAQQPGCIALT